MVEVFVIYCNLVIQKAMKKSFFMDNICGHIFEVIFQMKLQLKSETNLQ